MGKHKFRRGTAPSKRRKLRGNEKLVQCLGVCGKPFMGTKETRICYNCKMRISQMSLTEYCV